MKKSHAGLGMAGVLLFVAIIYSVLLFLLKPSFDVASWILYGFTLFSFVATMLEGFRRMGRMTAMQMPQLVVTLMYFLVQFIFGGIIMMTQTLLPPTPVVVVEIIWTALYLAFTFVLGIARSHASAQEYNDDRCVMDDEQLVVKLHLLAGSLTLGTLRQSVAEAADALRFSFPVTAPELQALQERIRTTVDMLEEAVEDHDEEAAEKYASKLKRLIAERGLKAKMYAK